MKDKNNRKLIIGDEVCFDENVVGGLRNFDPSQHVPSMITGVIVAFKRGRWSGKMQVFILPENETMDRVPHARWPEKIEKL